MQRETKKKLLMIIAGAVIIAAVCIGGVLLKISVRHKDGQMYTYIDYNEGTTKEINYYIDEENHAYRRNGRETVYVLLSDEIIKRNLAGELVVDRRENATEEHESAVQ